MVTQSEAIIAAFRELGGTRTISEITDWVQNVYGAKWKDFATAMADMVPVSKGGTHSSTVPDYYRVLERIRIVEYKLIGE